jgi:histidyl-tRNA synthetase
MQIERCKGCNDLTAEDMLRFRSVEAAFLETVKGCGYSEVKTPTLEYLHLFTSAGTLTPGMLRRVYSFLDWDGWSGERVVLKPDATIPVARFYADQLSHKAKLARLYYITNTFIFEETGRKSRERWQCGAELIGAGSALADVELITMACDSIKKMGIDDIKLKLSHGGLIKALLESMGISHIEQDNIFEHILNGDTGVLETLQSANPKPVEILKLLLGEKGKSAGFLKNLRSISADGMPQVQKELDSFISTVELLEKTTSDFEIDFTSGKGFEYYTGFIFRVFTGTENVGGGGRYDKLIGMMNGPSVPAAGFALYIDKLADVINIDSLYIPVAQRVSLDIDPSAMKDGTELADLLRKAGFVVMLVIDKSKPVDCGWEIEVKSDSPQFHVLNCGMGEKTTCDEAIETVAIMGLQ